MAQRYGGKFSPGGKTEAGATPAPHPYDGKRRSRVGAGFSLFFIFATLSILHQMWSAGSFSVFAVGGLLILLGAGWLTREGIRAKEAYDARRIARRPAIPRKLFGGVVTALAMGAATLAQPDGSLVVTGAISAFWFVTHFLFFGPDPWHNKGMEGIDSFQTDRVARAVDEAEKHLAAMKDAILRAGDRQLEARVERFITAARALFRNVENDPGDLTAARKYLGVYLMGARDATVKFADLYAQNRDASARAAYEALLTDLETNFAARSTALLSNNRTDLDIEIDVLRERLQREAPRSPSDRE